MSTFKAREEGTEKVLGSSLKAVEDVSHHSLVQTEALKEKQKTLSSLQATLSDAEEKCAKAEHELRYKVRELLVLESDMEHLERHNVDLRDRLTSITKENTELQFFISEEKEKACAALAGFNTYRDKMEGHRAAVLHVTSQTEIHKEREEKTALVKMLKLKKEELMEDLKNSNGKTVHMAKMENDALKEKMSAMKKKIAETTERLQNEYKTHTEIKKNIEIQNRRYEAIVKRLHCQLSRAQAVQRQLSGDIYYLQIQLAKLKRQTESAATK